QGEEAGTGAAAGAGAGSSAKELGSASKGRSKGKQKASEVKSPSKRQLKGDWDKDEREKWAQSRAKIMNLLLSELVAQHAKAARSEDAMPQAFLTHVDILELLSELVLAFPSCAMEIHRFAAHDHPRDLAASTSHAIQGCITPPATICSFLLHVLLPSPRSSASPKKAATAEQKKKRKLKIAASRRTAQASARLLVALAARAGEGRRRVLSELVTALSCRGASAQVGTDAELWALQAWGELVLGLAAPRASEVHNTDTNAPLSWEVVRIMMDLGVLMALTGALRRIDLTHTRAPLAASALIRPLEMLSRATVMEQVKKMRALRPGREKERHVVKRWRSRSRNRRETSAGAGSGASASNATAGADAEAEPPAGAGEDHSAARHDRARLSQAAEHEAADRSASLSFADDEAMLDEGFTGRPHSHMAVEVDIADMMDPGSDDESGGSGDDHGMENHHFMGADDDDEEQEQLLEEDSEGFSHTDSSTSDDEEHDEDGMIMEDEEDSEDEGDENLTGESTSEGEENEDISDEDDGDDDDDNDDDDDDGGGNAGGSEDDLLNWQVVEGGRPEGGGGWDDEEVESELDEYDSEEVALVDMAAEDILYPGEDVGGGAAESLNQLAGGRRSNNTMYQPMLTVDSGEMLDLGGSGSQILTMADVLEAGGH
ncbi:unnamed protein product, partial [Chrysoparadoxa australica]